MGFIQLLLSTTDKVALGFIAKKLCPELIMVNHHFDQYMEISGKIMNIFREYDPNMSAAGCDEGYLKYVTFCPRSCQWV